MGASDLAKPGWNTGLELEYKDAYLYSLLFLGSLIMLCVCGRDPASCICTRPPTPQFSLFENVDGLTGIKFANLGKKSPEIVAECSHSMLAL
jgi:hypothetical protein